MDGQGKNDPLKLFEPIHIPVSQTPPYRTAGLPMSDPPRRPNPPRLPPAVSTDAHEQAVPEASLELLRRWVDLVDAAELGMACRLFLPATRQAVLSVTSLEEVERLVAFSHRGSPEEQARARAEVLLTFWGLRQKLR